MNEMEQQEVLRNAQVILARQRQHIRQDRDKRAYKKWTDHEKYTLCLAISKYGILSTSKIAAVFPNRTDKQIRNFISKSLRDESAIPSLQDLIAHPPPGYVPPSQLAHLFRPPVPGGGDFMESERDQQNSSREATSLANNFGTMIGMAMGLSLVEFPEHKATETAPIKRPPQLTSSAPRFEALQPSFPSPLAPFTTAPVASSSSSSVASMSMESVGRMTYKELQERARKCTDKKEQAALLLMYYNQCKYSHLMLPQFA